MRVRTRREVGRLLRRALAGAGLLALALGSNAQAGTTGKLSGRVTDKAKHPLPSVNVAIPGARLGAITDAEGRYLILNIPAGTYDVKVSLLGYRATTVQGVVISADNSTDLDATLEEAPLPMAEVVVSAERPVVNLNLTSSMAAVSREQIRELPVQELQDVVNLQAGVVDGHFRGGRLGEVQYQVDGITVNNVYDNKSTLRLDRSLLEEVQVISGTFDAEYGQAMSGVVNAVLRRGSGEFRWDAETFGGGFAYPGSHRLVPYQPQSLGVRSYQLSLSGPTPAPKTFYLLNGRYYYFDDWVYGTRKYRPTDRSDFQNKDYAYWTGNLEPVPLHYSREWSGIAKVTNVSIPHIELNYQAVFNTINGRLGDWAWRLNPDGLSKQSTFSITHGLDLTHTLSKTTYYTVGLRQNRFDYKDRVYDDLYDVRYDTAGDPVGDPNYENGAILQGVSSTRFHQATSAVVLKGSLVSQYAHDQQLKAGAEFQWPRMRFGSMGYIVAKPDSTGRIIYKRYDNQPPTYPGVLEYRPYLAAAFAQEDLEWNDLRIRAGLRFEYFNPRAGLPSVLSNPANALPPPQPQSTFQPTTRKVSVAPRIGVSYPVTKDAALFFAYGHFYQLPPLGQVFNDADYRVLSTLQSGTSNYRVMGNPDIRPERTVQYQFGYKQAITEWLGLDASVFYKDIRDLLGTEFITTGNDAQYARLANVDFGNVVGFTVALDQRARGLVSTSLDYTWQLADGNSSDPRETATRAQAKLDPRPRQIPFNWDQRHTLNLTVMLAQPGVFNSSAILRVGSGQPYTPTVQAGFGGGLEPNSGRKPTSVTVDLRGERLYPLQGMEASLFGRVFNLFDSRFFNGFVFSSTGSPYYSSDPASDRVMLTDPTRYYGPRRIEVGLTLRAGKQS